MTGPQLNKTVVNCLLESCTCTTADVHDDVAASLSILHNNAYISGNDSSSKPKHLKMDCPRIGKDCNEQVWNLFSIKMKMFKDNTKMSQAKKSFINCISVATKI